MVFGAVLGSLAAGGLSGFLGGRSSRKARRRYRAQRAYGTRLLNDLRDYRNLEFSRMGGLISDAGRADIEGIEAARREVSASGRGSRQSILDQGQQAASSAQDYATRSGLGGSTMSTNLARGVGSDTTRRLMELNQSLSGLYSGLAQARGGAESNMNRELADLELQKYISEKGINDQMLGLWTGQMSGGQQPMSLNLGGLAQPFGQAFSWLGSLFGGGGGSTGNLDIGL